MIKRLEQPYKLSKSSRKKLSTCCQKLQMIVSELLYYMDITVICGTRTKEEQEEALKNGNSKATFGKSAHNYEPSLAVDIVPYPIPTIVKNGKTVWDDNNEKWDEMADLFKMIAAQKGIDIVWGGDWKSIVDKPHFELKNWRSYITTPQI